MILVLAILFASSCSAQTSKSRLDVEEPCRGLSIQAPSGWTRLGPESQTDVPLRVPKDAATCLVEFQSDNHYLRITAAAIAFPSEDAAGRYFDYARDAHGLSVAGSGRVVDLAIPASAEEGVGRGWWGGKGLKIPAASIVWRQGERVLILEADAGGVRTLDALWGEIPQEEFEQLAVIMSEQLSSATS